MRYDYSSIGFYTFDCLGRPVTAIPEGGSTIFIDELTMAVSGAAGTAVIAAAKMGLNCLAVGGVGQDMMGDWVLDRIASFGVDISGMQQLAESRTSSSIVCTRPDGSRPALHTKGATGDFYVNDALLDQAIDARVVHLGGIGLMYKMDGKRNAELMRKAKQRGAITTIDVFAGSESDMPAVEAVLRYTDYFMPSIDEVHALTGLSDLNDSAQFFLDRGVQCCVFTLGAEGAYYHHIDGTKFKVPAYAIDVKCTCGCGDAFDAGFAVALCHEFDPETAVRFGQATSALNATGLGSQAGVQSFEHTLNFMKTAKVRT
jgi:sugar/nucleoside kinase (ribokinase family)